MGRVCKKLYIFLKIVKGCLTFVDQLMEPKF